MLGLLLLVACVDPIRGVWIEADPPGQPLAGMDACPGDDCALSHFLLKKQKSWAFVTPNGEERQVWVTALEDGVSGTEGNGKSSPIFRGDKYYDVRIFGPEFTDDPETSLAGELHLCLVLADEMRCELQVEGLEPGSLPYAYYLRDGTIIPEETLEGG